MILREEAISPGLVSVSKQSLDLYGKAAELVGWKDGTHSFASWASVNPTCDDLSTFTSRDNFSRFVKTDDACDVEVLDVLSKESTRSRVEGAEKESNRVKWAVQDDDPIYECLCPAWLFG